MKGVETDYKHIRQEFTTMYRDVLRFWFEEIEPRSWWKSDPVFDESIRQRFLPTLRQAARCELDGWRAEPRGRLAEVLVLDQFSRNAWRDTPRAFAQDPLALALAQEAISAGADAVLTPVERTFLYLPFMHSESPRIHERAADLYRANGLQDNYEFELRHKAIIDRFGRYPHRNAILGRESTAEELAFLELPGSRF
jgi:uncharacterized protein (DUF924 family)